MDAGVNDAGDELLLAPVGGASATAADVIHRPPALLGSLLLYVEIEVRRLPAWPYAQAASSRALDRKPFRYQMPLREQEWIGLESMEEICIVHCTSSSSAIAHENGQK